MVCCTSSFFFPLPFSSSTTISVSPTCKSFPSFFSPSVRVTSTPRPIFLRYWRRSFSGSSSPGDDTYNEKSPPGKKLFSSRSLYNFLLYWINLSKLIPLSLSRNTFTLLVGFILISTRKISGSPSISAIIFCSSACICPSMLIVDKRRRERLRSLLKFCFRCKSKGNKLFFPKLIWQESY